jgi:hypothetical protein
MKSIFRNAISVLFLMTFITVCISVPASAQTGSASGTYRFVMEDGFSKSVEFNASSDERGATTGQMSFRDEAGVSEQGEDGGHRDDPPAEFFMTASLDSLTIDRNRAVMGGTITDSSNRDYIGRWVQLVVEDNGNGGEEPDKLTWCFCKPEEGGWVPSDAEIRDDEGAYWHWWATDAERRDDVGVQSENIIPGNKTSCKVLPLSLYEFAEVRSAEGAIVVQP